MIHLAALLGLVAAASDARAACGVPISLTPVPCNTNFGFEAGNLWQAPAGWRTSWVAQPGAPVYPLPATGQTTSWPPAYNPNAGPCTLACTTCSGTCFGTNLTCTASGCCLWPYVRVVDSFPVVNTTGALTSVLGGAQACEIFSSKGCWIPCANSPCGSVSNPWSWGPSATLELTFLATGQFGACVGFSYAGVFETGHANDPLDCRITVSVDCAGSNLVCFTYYASSSSSLNGQNGFYYLPWTSWTSPCIPSGCVATFQISSFGCGDQVCTAGYGGHSSIAYVDEILCTLPCCPSPTTVSTPTATATPSYTPNPMQAAIYAENGEYVRRLFSDNPAMLPPAIQLEPQFFEFPNAAGNYLVRIRLGERWTTWDGLSEEGEPVESGTYFLRAWYYDLGTGLIREEVMPIYVIRRDVPVRLILSSPSGEEVAWLDGEFGFFPLRSVRFCSSDAPPLPACSSVEPISPGDVSGGTGALPYVYPVTEPPVAILDSSGGPLRWDGRVRIRDDQGKFTGAWRWAENGTYHATLEHTDPSGRKIRSTGPVTVLMRAANIIRGASIVPNPVSGGGFTVGWQTTVPSEASVTVYDVSGRERARLDEGPPAAAREDAFRHSVRIRSGAGGLPRGVYVAVIRARERGGERRGMLRVPFAVTE